MPNLFSEAASRAGRERRRWLDWRAHRFFENVQNARDLRAVSDQSRDRSSFKVVRKFKIGFVNDDECTL